MTQIQWSAACGGGPGGTCPASGSLSSQYNVYAADIDLVDNTPPTVSSVSGPLVAGGTLTGSQAVSFNAADGQSGVYGGSLLVDGHTVVSQILNTNGGACESLNVTTDGQRSFEHAQPCESSLSASLTLNTNLLTAGQHSLELIVEDAAGNQTIAYNGTITTSGPPSVGVNGSINGRGPHIANGDPCAGEALELAVNGKRRPPIITYGKPVTVRGVLHCGTVPIRGARIAVATLGGPGSAAIDTSIETALDGSFAYKVPSGPDRTLQFSYTAYSDDPGPSATATVAIRIRPKIKLRIAPRLSSNGHSIHWAGTVTGGPYPPQGVTLDVEVKEGRRWRIFDQVVANSKGRFRLRLPLPRHRRTNDLHLPSRTAGQRIGRIPLHPWREQQRQRARQPLTDARLVHESRHTRIRDPRQVQAVRDPRGPRGDACSAMAGEARAGTYVINNCPSAPGANGDPGPWTVFGAPQNTKGSCTAGPGNWIGPEGGSMSPGALDGVQVVVPAGSGITIRGARIWWVVPHQGSGADTFALASVNTGVVEESGTPKDSSVTPDEWALPSNTTEFTLADYCSNDDAGNGCGFGAGENANLELLGSQLTLADSNLPNGTVTGGALAGTGTLAGTESLTYDAQDPDSGVRLVQLLLDGRPVAQKDYLPHCPYAAFAACPTTVSDEIRWNTTSANNGTHELALRVLNAAGNATIVDEHTVTINNPGIGVNGSINGRGPHIANGDPCAGEELELCSQRQTQATGPHLRPARDGQGCVALRHRADPRRADRHRNARWSGKRGDRQLRADRPGRLVLLQVPTGPARQLRFSYTAYSDDPAPSATATAAIRIRPRINLKINPHSSSNEHTIHWTGTVTGGPYPAQGVTLDVEVKERRGWRIFAQVVAGRKGHFGYDYRFHATDEPTTYTFRVALPHPGAQSYPYAWGASNTVNVHVSP